MSLFLRNGLPSGRILIILQKNVIYLFLSLVLKIINKVYEYELKISENYTPFVCFALFRSLIKLCAICKKK